MARPLFQLGPRLALCAKLVRGGRSLCDVGTDHAYLPIWLLKRGDVPSALACDINPGPLRTAAENARRYHVAERLALRLSDGLGQVAPEEADDVVVAGMGGEMILRIIEEAPWLKDPEKRLVLQPMSSSRDLRLGLWRLGFAIEREEAVLDGGRPYSAFSVRWEEALPQWECLYPWMGKLAPGGEAVTAYAQKTLRDLKGRLEGALRGRGEDAPENLKTAIEEIEKRFL